MHGQEQGVSIGYSVLQCLTSLSWRYITAYRANQIDSIRMTPRMSILGPSRVLASNKNGPSGHLRAVQGVEAIVVSLVIAAFEL
jgi:hypothetical protein